MLIRKALYLFTNDLRLQDNPCLNKALEEQDNILFVYILNKEQFQKNQYGLHSMGHYKCRFLYESLHALDEKLLSLGHQLLIFYSDVFTCLQGLIKNYAVNDVYVSKRMGHNEQLLIQKLRVEKTNFEHVFALHEVDSNTLFTESQIEHLLPLLPCSFSKLRRHFEKINIRSDIRFDENALTSMPSFVSTHNIEHTNTQSYAVLKANFENEKKLTKAICHGGEKVASQHLKAYFSSSFPMTYKQTRNELQGWNHSTKFSFWLAYGCLSPVQVVTLLQHYENSEGSNKSTRWIYFELLWREFFKWYAKAIGRKLFFKQGVKNNKVENELNIRVFDCWINGNTGFDIVDACMLNLKHTGYLSNRGRQIVASCFVNELAQDWRYGAAYFESVLIDYDVGANWGNWQYLAGVGVDPRGKRRFDLERQIIQFDPERNYINYWLSFKLE